MQLPAPILEVWEKLKTDRNTQLITLCAVLGVVLVILLIVALCCFTDRSPSGEASAEASTEAARPTLPPPEANPYKPEDFYLENGILKCSKAETLMGIDVSAHQKEIDWEQVAASGVRFAFVRIGYRGYVYGALSADDYYAANLEGARAAGIEVGAYFFSQAVSVEEALEEAEFALRLLDGYELDLPLVFDWEHMGPESRTYDTQPRILTDMTIAFCERVKAAGYTPMIYFNSSQALHFMHLEELTDYPFWLAMYDITMEFPYQFELWQYTNRGTLPGIDTFVDVNLMFVQE